jgi:metal-responsive CopG/Arc/MetJ family transcriptional regulator
MKKGKKGKGTAKNRHSYHDIIISSGHLHIRGAKYPSIIKPAE